jgi:hypothetical protein
MANYVQPELFDLRPYVSGDPTPDLYLVTPMKKSQGIENEQLELNLFPDQPNDGSSDLKQAA